MRAVARGRAPRRGPADADRNVPTQGQVGDVPKVRQ